eukprot:4046920-Pleurochrysis_carterae.AAC.1
MKLATQARKKWVQPLWKPTSAGRSPRVCTLLCAATAAMGCALRSIEAPRKLCGRARRSTLCHFPYGIEACTTANDLSSSSLSSVSHHYIC